MSIVQFYWFSSYYGRAFLLLLNWTSVLPVYLKERKHLNQERNRPGEDIGNIQTLGCVELLHLENRHDPADTDTADTQHGDDHGRNGCAHTPERAGGYIHQAADKVEAADDIQPHQTPGNGFRRIGDVDRQQILAK